MLNNVDEIELSKQVAKGDAKFALASTPGNPFLPATVLASGDNFEFWIDENPVSTTSIEQSLNELHLKASRKELGRSPENAYLLNNLGLSLLNSGRTEEAISHFQQALAANQSFTAAKLNLAHAYLTSERLDAALGIYKELEGSYANSDVVRANIAEILLRRSVNPDSNASRRNLEEAKQHLLAIENRTAPSDNTLGLIHSLLGDGRQAVNHFRRALTEDPRSSVYHLNLAAWHSRSKNYKKAIVHFRAGLVLDPKNKSAVKNLANCYIELGNYINAEEILREYRDNSSDDIEYLTLMALAAYYRYRFKASLGYLSHALDLAKSREIPTQELALIYNNIGCAYDGLGELTKAAEYFHKSINLPTPQAEAFLNLTYQRLSANAPVEAAELMKQFEQTFPNEKRLPYLKARYHFHIGDYEECLQYLKQALEKQPRAHEVYATASYVYFEIRGEYAKAIELVKQGLRYNPSNLILVNNLAYYYIMMGELERGRQVLDQISGPDASENPYLIATRGLLHIKDGNLREAERFYGIAFSKVNKEIRNQMRQKYFLELGRYWLSQNKPELADRHLRQATAIESVCQLYAQQAASLLRRN